MARILARVVLIVSALALLVPFARYRYEVDGPEAAQVSRFEVGLAGSPWLVREGHRTRVLKAHKRDDGQVENETDWEVGATSGLVAASWSWALLLGSIGLLVGQSFLARTRPDEGPVPPPPPPLPAPI